MNTEKKQKIATSRGAAVLLAIHDLRKRFPWPPTFAEIGEVTGLRRVTVGYSIGVLAEKGFIERTVNARRALVLTPEGKKVVRKLKRKKV